jgi:hypothetical protein
MEEALCLARVELQEGEGQGQGVVVLKNRPKRKGSQGWWDWSMALELHQIAGELQIDYIHIHHVICIAFFSLLLKKSS